MSEEIQQEPQEGPQVKPKNNIVRMLALLGAAIVVLLIGYIAVTTISRAADPCSADKIKPVIDKLQTAAQRFDDANKLANNTPRVNLPTVISELQASRRDAQAVEVPACAVKAQNAMVAYMDAQTDVYITFMDPKNSDSLVSSKQGTADNALSDYFKAMDELTSRFK